MCVYINVIIVRTMGTASITASVPARVPAAKVVARLPDGALVRCIKHLRNRHTTFGIGSLDPSKTRKYVIGMMPQARKFLEEETVEARGRVRYRDGF